MVLQCQPMQTNLVGQLACRGLRNMSWLTPNFRGKVAQSLMDALFYRSYDWPLVPSEAIHSLYIYTRLELISLRWRVLGINSIVDLSIVLHRHRVVRIDYFEIIA